MNELYVFADVHLTNQTLYFSIVSFILSHTNALSIEKLIRVEIKQDKEEQEKENGKDEEEEMPDPEEIQQVQELYFSHFFSLINGITKFDDK